MTYAPNPTTFNPIVWDIVRQVTHGHVSTYGQIASMLPQPADVDAQDFKRLAPMRVGDALNAVSFSDADGQAEPTDIPWWRIINSKGGISLPAGSRVAMLQKQRLEAEGVTFNAQGLTDLNRFGWLGPDADWLVAHGFLAPKPIRKPDDTSPQQLSLF